VKTACFLCEIDSYIPNIPPSKGILIIMNGRRVVVSAAHSKVHHSRSQHLHSLVPLLPGFTNEAVATRTYLLTPRSGLYGVPGVIRKKFSAELEGSG
jgi:hypothetical protein